MKKFIAIVLSIQLILLQVLPAQAQLVKPVIRGVFQQTATQTEKQVFVSTLTKAPALELSSYTAANSYAQAQASALPLYNAITRTTGNNVLNQWVATETVFKRANFTSVSNKAPVDFWRRELTETTEKLAKLPAEKLTAEAFTKVQNQPALHALGNVLQDISAIGLFGGQTDAARLVDIYRRFADTQSAPVVAAAVSKALIRLQAYAQLQQLLDLTAGKTINWQGLGQYALQHQIDVTLPATKAVTLQTTALQNALKPLGQMTANAADTSASAIEWYVNLGAMVPANVTPKKQETVPNSLNILAEKAKPARGLPVQLQPLQLSAPAVEISPAKEVKPAVKEVVADITAKNIADNTGLLYSGIPVPFLTEKFNQLVQKVKSFIIKDKTVPQEIKNDATLLQQASIYLTSIVIGLEIGTPIMASLGSSLDLSLEENILVTVATFLPYSIGSLLSNWLKEKFGRKASANIGLGLMAASFIAGAVGLGLDGSFVPWANTTAHFWSILAALTSASFGGVFVHNAVGPMMTELSKNTSELVQQKRVSYTELVRAGGMLSSYAFPFIATSFLGMDWSSSFVMALPFVAASFLAINMAKIPNTKPATAAAKEMAAGIRGRRGLNWKKSLLDNNYLRLFREDKTVGPLIGGLFLMNAVEMGYNSGFLLLLPSITNDPSSQYLFGLTQYAVPFVLGRYLAGKFLNWFPNHNLSIATAIAAAGGAAALGVTGDVYALTAALFMAELGTSTAFTLSFAKTAKNHLTQDRITTLIVGTAVACAIGPVLFTTIAQQLIDAGILSVADATAAMLIGVPSVLALISAGLFKKIEQVTAKSAAWQKIKSFFKRPAADETAQAAEVNP